MEKKRIASISEISVGDSVLYGINNSNFTGITKDKLYEVHHKTITHNADGTTDGFIHVISDDNEWTHIQEIALINLSWYVLKKNLNADESFLEGLL